MIKEINCSIPFLSPNITSSKPISDLLAEEYFCLQDMDGNGLIYGYDFYIKGIKPNSILDLELNEYWKEPTKYIESWSDYLENNIQNIISLEEE